MRVIENELERNSGVREMLLLQIDIHMCNRLILLFAFFLYIPLYLYIVDLYNIYSHIYIHIYYNNTLRNIVTFIAQLFVAL